jgi:Family of unknown function (DUF6444)
LLLVTDAPGELPADLRDVLIREQAEKIAALEAVVADLREQLGTLLREKSRNSGNSSLPSSSDDAVPGRKQPSRQQRRAAERSAKKKRGKQPGSVGTSMTWEVPDRTEDHSRRAPARAAPAGPPRRTWALPGPSSRKRSRLRGRSGSSTTFTT